MQNFHTKYCETLLKEFEEDWNKSEDWNKFEEDWNKSKCIPGLKELIGIMVQIGKGFW